MNAQIHMDMEKDTDIIFDLQILFPAYGLSREEHRSLRTHPNKDSGVRVGKTNGNST